MEAVDSCRAGKSPARVKSRLVEAFWSLVAERALDEITVADIVDAAGCNRGSFYYHYGSKENFIETVVKEGFESADGLFGFISELISDDEPRALTDRERKSFGRMGLLMRQGGADIVEREAESRTVRLLSAALCLDAASLEPETIEIVEFTSKGLLGILKDRGDRLARHAASASREFLQAVVKKAVHYIARAQGVDEDEVLVRIQVLRQVRSMGAAPTGARPTLA